MKRCPYCAEEIQDQAIICRFCGRDLRLPLTHPYSEAPKQPHTTSAHQEAIPYARGPLPSPRKSKSRAGIGCLVFGLLVVLVVLGAGALFGTAYEPAQSEPQDPNPTTVFTSSDDLCTWFFQTQALRAQRLSGLIEFTNWALTHDLDSLTSGDALEMVAILVRYQPYQEDFILAWQALGPHPQAREFWELELESVQLRLESVNAMAASLDTNNEDEFARAWDLFAQSQTIGKRGESAMLVVRARCVP